MFEYKGNQYTYEDLQIEAKKQGVEFNDFMEKMKGLGMTHRSNDPEKGLNLDMSSQQPFRQDQDEEERGVLDVLKSYGASLGIGTVSIANNFTKLYETGEGGLLSEVLFENPFVASYGYAAEYLRGKGYDIPEEFLGTDLTTPGMRREIYENHMLDAREKGLTLEQAQKLDPTNKIKFEETLEWFNKHTYTYKDENGDPMDYLSLVSDGKVLEAADAFVNDAFGAVPSLVVSRLPYGSGAAILGAGAYMDNFEREMYKRGFDDETTRNQVMKDSFITGASDFTMELIGGRILNKIIGSGIPKDKAKDLLTNVPKVIAKKFGLGYVSEFTTEGLTGVMQTQSKEWSYGDIVTYKQNLRAFFKDGFLGGFLGGGATIMSTPNQRQVYDYVSPSVYKQEQLKIEKEIVGLTKDADKAEGNNKEILEEKIKELQDKKELNKKNLYEFFDSLTKAEKQEYANNIDEQHKNLDIIGNSEYSEATQKKAKEDYKKFTDANSKFFAGIDIDYDSDLEQAIGRTLKASERIQEQKGVFGFNKKNLDIEYVDSEKRLEELNVKFEGFDKADGMFVDNSGSKSKIYINQQVAALKGATNVIGHEYLHAIVSQAFSEGIGAANLKGATKSFVEYLKSTGPDGARIVERIEERLANKYNGRNAKGDIIRDSNGLVKTKKKADQEEYFNLFSDIIKDEKIESVEAKSAGIKNSFRALFRGLGFGEVDFQNGQEVFDFLVDYNTNMKRSSILGKLTSKRIAKVKMKGLEAKADKRFKSGTDALVSDNKKSATDSKGPVDDLGKMGWTDKTWKESGAKFAIETIKDEKLIDALIYAKYKVENVPANFVNDVITALTSDIKKFNSSYINKKTGKKVEAKWGTEQENDSLFGYLQGLIQFRADDVYKELYRGDSAIEGAKDIGETTKEGEVKVQVAAETDTAMEALETEDLSPAAQAKKKADKAKGKEKVESEFRREIGIETGGDLYNKVLDSARKALLRAYEAGTSVRNIQRKLRDEANVYLFKSVKNFLGTKDYFKNLKKFREPIVKAIFTADLVQIERNVPDNERIFTTFVKKLTSKQEVEDAVNQKLLPPSALNIIDKGTAVSLYKKKMPTEKQFLDFFYAPLINPVTGSRSGLRGTRKDGLAKAMAGALSYDATMEVAQEQDVIEKREQLAALKGETLAQDNLETLAAAIGRDPSVKFSKSTLTDSKRGKAALYLQAKENSLTDGHPAKPFFELTRKLVEEEMDVVDALTISKEQLGVESEVLNLILKDGNLDNSHVDNIVWAINNFVVAKIRKLGHDTSVKYLENQLKEKSTKEKISIVNEYLANVGRSLRSAKVDDITTNALLLEQVIQKLGDKKLADRYSLKDILTGQKIQYKDGAGNIKDVELYENIENIKNNAYNNSDLTQKVNDQAKKAQAYIFKILDSNLTKSEKKAVVQLMAYDQRGALRKVSKLGMVVDRSSKLGKKYNSKNTVLEHELTSKDLQDKVNDYIDGKIDKETLQETFDKATVHVLPKTIDGILSAEGLRHKGGFDRYNNAKVKKAINKLVENKTLLNAKFSKSTDFKNLNKAVSFSRSTNNPTKGITVLDFDDTLATTKSLVKFTRPDGTTGTLNAEQYASTYENLLDQGYTFDFSEFNKVVKGKLAPLFQKALKLQGKFGPENMFVLTARPPAAQKAIFDFLKANGLNIPIKNITGLGNSTSEAKALWVADKVGEGYNDFYFADDALQNVQAVKNMLDQFDVKSKVQQARVKFSKNMDTEFNNILEDVTGIESKKRFSIIKGRKRGDSKGKFRFFIPPSHEDFVGLLYNFMGKGKEGNKHRDFFEQALVRPLNRGYREIDTAKQAIANDYKSLNKQFPDVKDKLVKATPDGDFTFQDAIRVYLWDKHGHKIPGLTETDQKKLAELVMSDPQLQSYAETLNVISKQENYVAPGEAWETANIRIDLVDATGRVGRADYFTEFNENAEVMFSEENLNKIEAGYGRDFREALEDMLHRIKTGVNRPKGASGKPNMFMNWLNASVSGVMFFNTRSALLQQMSNVNFLNFADNNIFKAGLAFANQKQYWKDFAMIFNSDMLKQRRGGLGTDINGAELAEAIKKARPDNMFDQVSIIVGKALKLGFLPTQIGDNIAIATGGAAFYRNRVNKYVKDGLSVKEAETKAFTDLQNITQSTQQSARPDMTSKQQASWIGKLVLNFLNTPSQYNRIIKKAGSDVINRRITPPNTTQTQSDMSNASRILYYGAAQNLIFYSLQTALFAVMFGDDDEENEAFLKKKERVINGSIDTILRGSGIYGVAVSTLKNMAIKFLEQREKGYNKDESAVIMEMLNFSPVVGIKARKIVNAEKTLNYNKKVIDEMETFDIDNPQWSAVTNYVESITTAPVNRLYQKTINLRNAADNDYTALQRALFFSGYTTWSLDLGDTEKMEKIKSDIKEKKKQEKKKSKKKKNRFGPRIL